MYLFIARDGHEILCAVYAEEANAKKAASCQRAGTETHVVPIDRMMASTLNEMKATDRRAAAKLYLIGLERGKTLKATSAEEAA